MGLLIYLYSYRLHEGALNIHNTICVNKSAHVNNIQIVLVVKRKWGNVEEPLHHMYILKIHILKVYGQSFINTLLNNVVLCLSYMINWDS